jgi:hypothetical protein
MSEITDTIILALIDQSRPDDRVYIQQRGPNKNLPGTYEPILEKVEPEDFPKGIGGFENYRQFRAYLKCAQRGCEQEAGITPTNLEFITLIAPSPENNYHQAAIIVGYTTETPTPNSDETVPEESYFRTIEEVLLLEPMHPALTHILPLLEDRLK